MEDDLNIDLNGRQPQFQGKWKKTSICWQMEDNLHFLQMEDNLNFFIVLNGRQPQFPR